MQFVFLVILACHVPFVFFACKESFLIIVDEVLRHSLSYALTKKMAAKPDDEQEDLLVKSPNHQVQDNTMGSSNDEDH